MKFDLTKNTLVCGDNMDWLKDIPDNSIDMCYIDPPFFSNRNYEIIWGNGAEVASFGDRFSGGVKHYIEWMTPRIQEIHRVLKDTGSIFLHCDCNASHRLRFLLDEVFGESNFNNLITWKRCDTHNDAKHQFPVTTDQIIFYSKTNKAKFKKCHTAYPEKTLKEWYLYLELKDGTTRKMTPEEILKQKPPKGSRRYNTGDMASPNPRKNLMYKYKGYDFPKKGWRYSKETMKELDDKNLLLFPSKKTQRIMRKRYLDEQNGPVCSDLWEDISFLRSNVGESLDYPTQKPEALLKRIIECSTSENDMILDCFGGGFTTAKVALDLNRKFICGDVSPVAIRMGTRRLLESHPDETFYIKGLPGTVDWFQQVDGHIFADMVCDLMGWKVNNKKSGDNGIDGWDGHKNPIQVKNYSKKAVSSNDIRNFAGSLLQEKKDTGVFVGWKFSKQAKEAIATLRQSQKVDIQIKDARDIFKEILIIEEKHENIINLFKDRLPKDWDYDETKEFTNGELLKLVS